MSRFPTRLSAGRPYPIGATAEISGVNFAVFSAHAEKIELCLFDRPGGPEVARLPLPECTNDVFHGFLPDCRPGQLYGYRAYGPYQPEKGHRFNPNKLLLDPYAKALAGELHWSDSLFGYRLAGARADLSFDRRDSAFSMPKGIVVPPDPVWEDDRRPNVPWSQTVIYEAHVRGLSLQHPDIPVTRRGTFAALADPAMIDHFLRLGITAVELLPVHAFLQDRMLLDKGLRNYWGYNTLAFFAPAPRYLSIGGTNEMRLAVKRLHAAGIEVILDVVYNHTCEGSELGPTLSWRGLDNASYYRLLPGQERYLINDTGTGNTINISHPRVLQMVLDSLRYWATSYGIDGFRFDLGSILGREPTGFDRGSGFFDAILQDPVLSQLKLISEPWDIGPGGYQLGNQPPGFAEWNDRFRDGIRRFARGDSGVRADAAGRLAGSGDIFDHSHRHPWASVNFITSHDGFTLHDLVSYSERHNEANGEDNRDGHSENLSGNWGAEGPTDDPVILALRERVKRTLLSLLFFAHGTPMLLAGDEMGRTQRGNNNAYCQDNEISWLNWSDAAAEPAQALVRFTSRLIAIRRRWPSLQGIRFMHGSAELLPGIPDISWFDERGVQLAPEDWSNAEGRLLVLRRAARHADDGGPPMIGVTLLLMNATGEDRDFILPTPTLDWQLLSDSADPDMPREVVPDRPLMIGRNAAVLLGVRCERPA